MLAKNEVIFHIFSSFGWKNNKIKGKSDWCSDDLFHYLKQNSDDDVTSTKPLECLKYYGQEMSQYW